MYPSILTLPPSGVDGEKKSIAQAPFPVLAHAAPGSPRCAAAAARAAPPAAGARRGRGGPRRRGWEEAAGVRGRGLGRRLGGVGGFVGMFRVACLGLCVTLLFTYA